MLTVVTTFYPSEAYKADYVRVLAQQALRHGADNFICLTRDKIPGVVCLPLNHKWPGWWTKLEVCSLELPGTALFLDLDTMIFSDISFLADYPSPMFPRDSSYQKEPSSTLMLFRDRELTPLYDTFLRDPIAAMDRTFAPHAPNRIYGDQVFMAEVMRRLHMKWHALQDVNKAVLSYIWEHPTEQPKTPICAFGAEWKPWGKHPRFKRYGGWWRPLWERECTLAGVDPNG